MTSASIAALALLAVLAACADGAALAGGRSLNPMVRPRVWPMPSLGSGLASTEIIGGQDAKFGEFPYQLSMQVSMLWILEQHICGATIIGTKWAITAAHCVKGVPWYTSAFVLAGKTNLAKKEAGQQRSAVRKMYAHESYRSDLNGGVGPYDIGLLELKTPLVFSDTVKPARLPELGVIPAAKSLATLTGWGSTSTSQEVVIPNNLQKEDLEIISFNDCYDFVQKESAGADNPLVDTNICVGSLTQKGQGACSGDSGGPLVQYSSAGDPVVIGATSWGYFPCQQQPAPSVYTRVSAYTGWITTKTGITP